jgi:MerR-like DNA binding protein
VVVSIHKVSVRPARCGPSQNCWPHTPRLPLTGTIRSISTASMASASLLVPAGCWAVEAPVAGTLQARRIEVDLRPESKVYVDVVGAYRISQLADRVGIPATTLRFYEKIGLLPSQRTAAGYRVYDDAAADRLHFIAAGKNLGLPLDQIRGLLSVWESGACRDVRDEL